MRERSSTEPRRCLFSLRAQTRLRTIGLSRVSLSKRASFKFSSARRSHSYSPPDALVHTLTPSRSCRRFSRCRNKIIEAPETTSAPSPPVSPQDKATVLCHQRCRHNGTTKHPICFDRCQKYTSIIIAESPTRQCFSHSHIFGCIICVRQGESESRPAKPARQAQKR